MRSASMTMLPAMSNRRLQPITWRLNRSITTARNSQSSSGGVGDVARPNLVRPIRADLAIRARARSEWPPGNGLADLDFAAVPGLLETNAMAVAEASSWIGQWHNLLTFDPPHTAESHLRAAMGHTLIDRGLNVRQLGAWSARRPLARLWFLARLP